MNKLFTKIALLSVGLTAAVGAGVFLNSGRNFQKVNAANTQNLPIGTYSATLSVSGTGKTLPTELGIYSSDDTVYKNISFAYVGCANSFNNEITMKKTSDNNGNNTTITTNNHSNATITTVEIDWYQYATPVLYKADGTTSVTPTAGTNTSNNKSLMKVYTVNDSNFSLVNSTNYNCSFYSMKINFTVTSLPTTYSIMFNANASLSRPALDVPQDINDLDDGASRTISDTPTRWGYSFLGWGLTNNATAPYISSVTIDGADVVLYAIWEEDHTVTGAWSDCPYTVAEASTAIDAGENLTEVYVTGIISQIDSYNANYHSLQYWISDDGTTTDQLEVYSGRNLNNTDFAATTDIEKGATVTICGTLKKFGSVYEFDKSNYLVSYTEPARAIDFTFAPSTLVANGSEGTFSYECEVEGVTASYVSSDSTVIEILNASTGTYRAKSAGIATITLTLTKGSDSGSKEVDIKVAAVKTVSEAVAIASQLSNNATTADYYFICGFITKIDSDGNARAINVTDGSNVIMFYFGSNNDNYASISSSSYVGNKLSVFGRIQNYGGLYEVKEMIVHSNEAADADSYSAGAYMSLASACESGPAAVTPEQLVTLGTGFNHLSEAEQEKLQANDVSSYGQNVVNWVNRYTIICNNTSFVNFMGRSGISNSSQLNLFELAQNNNFVVVVIISITSIVALSGLVLLKKKRRHSR